MLNYRITITNPITGEAYKFVGSNKYAAISRMIDRVEEDMVPIGELPGDRGEWRIEIEADPVEVQFQAAARQANEIENGRVLLRFEDPDGRPGAWAMIGS